MPLAPAELSAASRFSPLIFAAAFATLFAAAMLRFFFFFFH
jgi:hypothetical protein